MSVKSVTTRAGRLFAAFFATAITICAQATTLEEQVGNLEKSVQTVDQRRKIALKDLTDNVLKAYRNAIRIDSVDTTVAEVFGNTARVKIVVDYSVDFEAAQAIRSTLSKYFVTATDREAGVEPYGMIYTHFDECVGSYCAVQKEMRKLLENSAVGVDASMLGEWDLSIMTNGSGRFDLKSGTATYLIDVPKSKIKGNPKPVVKGQIYDVHYCSVRRAAPCSGLSFSRR
jgi:hypothetical protein